MKTQKQKRDLQLQEEALGFALSDEGFKLAKGTILKSGMKLTDFVSKTYNVSVADIKSEQIAYRAAFATLSLHIEHELDDKDESIKDSELVTDSFMLTAFLIAKHSQTKDFETLKKLIESSNYFQELIDSVEN